MPAKALILVASVMLASEAATAADDAPFRLAMFSADVTPPLGHPLLGGTTTPPPAHAIDDPLFAKGFVLLGGRQPVVLVSIDWCEIRNDAFDRWRDVLAAAAGTSRECVLVTAIHQHDAPLADLEAQRILDRSPLGGALVDFDYHERCVQKTADALKAGLKDARRVTHFGVSQAKVEKIASNRRYLDAQGQPHFDRSSMSGADPVKADAPEGEIDPFLKTLSFWDGDVPVCGLHVYSVHPMGRWGSGRVTADFPGLARERLQAQDESVFQIYASGCAGDTTAGKYNDASERSRRGLQERLYQAMAASWKAAKRQPLTKLDIRSVPLNLPLRSSAGYSQADLEQQLKSDDPKKRRLAALGLSWRQRHEAHQPIDLPVVDFGSAVLVLLPGETYVRFQLAAQKLRPDDFVMVMGYGESAPGFIPMEKAWEEHDSNLNSWCWVDPGSERPLMEALQRGLAPME